MEYFPAPLEKLVEQFARLPGIGGKSAQRLAFHILDLPESEAQEFAQAILDAKHNVTCCPECQNFTRRRTVPHLRFPQAGRQHHLRGGGSPGMWPLSSAAGSTTAAITYSTASSPP